MHGGRVCSSACIFEEEKYRCVFVVVFVVLNELFESHKSIPSTPALLVLETTEVTNTGKKIDPLILNLLLLLLLLLKLF